MSQAGSSGRAAPEHLVLASGNAGKLAELKDLMRGVACEVSPLSRYSGDNPEEPGEAFVENAIIKARFACQVSGLPAIADDSGIIVDALRGRPGVRSARFAGPDATDQENLELLLKEMQGVPEARRTARFVSVVAYMEHAADPLPLIAVGLWEGFILEEARGENGFGYDPIFGLFDDSRSSAELAPAEKNARSHRGQALRGLLDMAGWSQAVG